MSYKIKKKSKTSTEELFKILETFNFYIFPVKSIILELLPIDISILLYFTLERETVYGKIVWSLSV